MIETKAALILVIEATSVAARLVDAASVMVLEI